MFLLMLYAQFQRKSKGSERDSKKVSYSLGLLHVFIYACALYSL